MAWFDWIGRQSREKWELEKEFLRERHDQKLDLERRRKEIDLLTAEKRSQLERARLDYQIKSEEEKLKEDFEDFEDETLDDGDDSQEMKLLAPFLTKILNKNTAPVGDDSSRNTATPPTTQQAAPPGLTFTDEELDEIYKSTPDQYKKLAKLMTDEQIKKFIRSRYPAITDECLSRACIRIKR